MQNKKLSFKLTSSLSFQNTAVLYLKFLNGIIMLTSLRFISRVTEQVLLMKMFLDKPNQIYSLFLI